MVKMELTDIYAIDYANFSTDSPSTTEATPKFSLSDYLLSNYILIIIPSIFVCIFLIILFIIIIKKIINRNSFDVRQLETYASVNYAEDIDEDLDSLGDTMYTSCRLLVGEKYEENGDRTNCDPEYDCMSVDVTVSAKESAIVDWSKSEQSPDNSPVAQNLKTLPHNFWKR